MARSRRLRKRMRPGETSVKMPIYTAILKVAKSGSGARQSSFRIFSGFVRMRKEIPTTAPVNSVHPRSWRRTRNQNYKRKIQNRNRLQSKNHLRASRDQLAVNKMDNVNHRSKYRSSHHTSRNSPHYRDFVAMNKRLIFTLTSSYIAPESLSGFNVAQLGASGS